MKKVMVFFHDSDIKSGATGSMMDVVEGWKKQKLLEPICIFPKYGNAVEYAKENGIACEVIRYYPVFIFDNISFVNKIFMYFKRIIQMVVTGFSLTKIEKLIRIYEIDVVYTNTKTIIIGALVNKKYHVPHIWHIREYGLEDHGMKFLISDRTYARLFSENTNQLIFISQSLCQYYESKYKTKHSHVIYDDVSARYLCSKNNTSRHIKNFLIAGTICKGKGQLEVVEAFLGLNHEQKRADLFIAGRVTDVEYEKKIKELVNINDINNAIHFLGLVENMNELRSQIDVGIVASGHEAFGRVTIEGMLSGLIMLGANCGGTSELIINKETGYLYKKGDVKDLADKVSYILEASPIELNRIRTRASDFAYQFTKGQCANSISKIVNDL